MNEQEKQRRVFFAQGFAAIALFFCAHSAHAATLPAAHAHPAQGHGAAAVQRRP
ncbi:MAG TPA: hypothetical protein VFA30_08090 [Gaiellaceae bacterium]|nr:hypothetical protein [Gaiellaceae bacterium]